MPSGRTSGPLTTTGSATRPIDTSSGSSGCVIRTRRAIWPGRPLRASGNGTQTSGRASTRTSPTTTGAATMRVLRLRGAPRSCFRGLLARASNSSCRSVTTTRSSRVATGSCAAWRKRLSETSRGGSHWPPRCPSRRTGTAISGRRCCAHGPAGSMKTSTVRPLPGWAMPSSTSARFRPSLTCSSPWSRMGDFPTRRRCLRSRISLLAGSGRTAVKTMGSRVRKAGSRLQSTTQPARSHSIGS